MVGPCRHVHDPCRTFDGCSCLQSISRRLPLDPITSTSTGKANANIRARRAPSIRLSLPGTRLDLCDRVDGVVVENRPFTISSMSSPRNIDLQLPDACSSSRRSSYGSDTDSRLPSGKTSSLISNQAMISDLLVSIVLRIHIPSEDRVIHSSIHRFSAKHP